MPVQCMATRPSASTPPRTTRLAIASSVPDLPAADRFVPQGAGTPAVLLLLLLLLPNAMRNTSDITAHLHAVRQVPFVLKDAVQHLCDHHRSWGHDESWGQGQRCRACMRHAGACAVPGDRGWRGAARRHNNSHSSSDPASTLAGRQHVRTGHVGSNRNTNTVPVVLLNPIPKP